MLKPNKSNEYCGRCTFCQQRWQELCSCENMSSDHFKHIMHWTHPACEKFTSTPKSEEE